MRAIPSRYHAVLELIEKIGESFNDRRDFLGIYIDFSKAFDDHVIVDHEILLNKKLTKASKQTNKQKTMYRLRSLKGKNLLIKNYLWVN